MPVGRVIVIIAVLGLAGCGGSDKPEPSSSPLRSVEFELARTSDIGLRQALVTLAERSDRKTTALFDFYVPRTPQTRDLVYPTALRTGSCDDSGTSRELGDLPAGPTTVVIDDVYDDVVTALEEGRLSIAIMRPDGSAVAWCGPG